MRLASDARIILFDEPTSSLPQKDVTRLFEIIHRLKQRGIGVVYISHFLEEVREVADAYSVLRDGQHVGSGKIDDVTDPQIVSMMVGRDVDDLFPSVPHTPGEAWVEVTDMQGVPYPRHVSVALRRGEIFGVAGLVGAGRTELLRSIFGLDYTTAGAVTVEGRSIAAIGPGSHASRLWLVVRGSQRRRARPGSIDHRKHNARCAGQLHDAWFDQPLADVTRSPADLMRRVEVKARSGRQPVSELSGGNQQKVAIARILHQQANILMMDEPTKGIDVGTKAEIYRMMGSLAAEGRTVVFVSSYLPELLAVCDRIGVMARGQMREIRDASRIGPRMRSWRRRSHWTTTHRTI